MTTDEALRVAREALENILGVEVMAPEGGREEVTEIHGIARSALRTIALAVEAPSNAVQSVALGEPKDDAAWDASQIKPPGWDHVFAAFVEGAREARANPDATEDDFRRAADGHTKRVFEEVDPVSEAALRTESWQSVRAKERCLLCDDTGDVHDQTGEWRGYCTCQAGRERRETDAEHAPRLSAKPQDEGSTGAPA